LGKRRKDDSQVDASEEDDVEAVGLQVAKLQMIRRTFSREIVVGT